MKHEFFKVPAEGGEAEEELNRFVGAHRVVAQNREFVSNGADSYWALYLRYLDPQPGEAPARRGKVDYRDELSEEEFAVFARLRDLRKTLAERENVPPYALFTNEQLATIVRQRVSTLAELGAISGVGPSRLEKYGAAVIEL